VFIGNVVKCRPPNNREPLKDEVDACLPFLRRQIDALHPKVIVCLGKVALNNMLGTNHSMGRIRGQLLSFNGIPLLPTYHPAFILHKKDKDEITRAKWEVWEDMQKVLALVPKKRP
jgi:DNA polymerase